MHERMNIVGCGKLGRTLARLWTEHSTLTIQGVLNRAPEHTSTALAFIGAGHAVDCFASLQPAQYTLIGAGDDQIATCCEQLAASGVLRPGDIVFHCSGALPASVLAAARACGALIASAHPLASFANPAQLAQHFSGSWCTLEGDDGAVASLERAFAQIGALTQRISSEHKLVYHAAAVFASNYLVTVLDAALQAAQLAGISSGNASRMLAPLIEESVRNVLQHGAAQALSGPIRRGDYQTVRRQQSALAQKDAVLGEFYRQLAQATARLAQRPPPFD